MNKSLLEENKKKLLAEQKRLKQVLSHEGKFEGKGEFPGDYKPQFTEAGSEEGENASEVEQFQNDLSVTEDLEDRLTLVESALKRIENGSYGKCTVGGEEIEESRLQAEPAAAACVKHSK